MKAMTLCEKILARTSGRDHVFPGEFIWAEPDVIIHYDWPGLSDEMADLLGKELGVKVKNPEKCYFFIDHLLPPNQAEALFHQATRDWVAEQGIPLSEGQGIGHQVSAELGLARPGGLIVHGDSHVQVLGAYGALTFSLLTDVVTPLALGRFWLEVPATIKVVLKGRFPAGVQGRDLINRILGEIGPDGAIGTVMEFVGDGAENMSIDDRMGLLSEIVFCGAYCGVFPGDSLSAADLKARTGKDFAALRSDPDAVFVKELIYDLSEMTPYIVAPESLYAGRPVKDASGLPLNQGYIGSCACGRKADLDIAAKLLKGRKIKDGFRLYVVPSSREAMVHAAKNGSLAALLEAGAYVSSPTCDYCYGKLGCMVKGERAISTGTLNVPGRMGSMEAEIYLGSAATVAASAVTGTITDPTTLIGAGGA
ncbi:MAG: aconitase family protein [Clostridiales bacterium]|nr:aconitase family protein [Clostridiales bacterium]